MSIPVSTIPPPARTTYVLDQLEGERVTIPGSKGVFRILASSKQTNGGIAVFTSGAVLSDAPGFHWHETAHDVFLVTKGFLKLWNGDRCRILGPGDFAYVPPAGLNQRKIVHNPELLGPHSELLGLVAPGDWIDFFRYVGETYKGVLVPETDDRDLRALLMQKMMAAKDRFDVHFERDYLPPELSGWESTENQLAEPGQPYFLRANTGPRWLFGGVMSRPFILSNQCGGKFAISSIESSRVYQAQPLKRWLTFKDVDHCFCVQEGLLRFRLKSSKNWEEVREGQTLVIAAREKFALDFASRYVRVWSFTDGQGIEELVKHAGQPCESFLLPDTLKDVDMRRLWSACEDLDIETAEL